MATWKGKRINVNMIEFSFQRDEAHFFEAAYLDELAEDGEVIASKPRGVSLPIWEELEGKGP